MLVTITRLSNKRLAERDGLCYVTTLRRVSRYNSLFEEVIETLYTYIYALMYTFMEHNNIKPY